MDKSASEILSEEYCKILNSPALQPLKLAAYLRFETKDGRFVKKFKSTIIRSIFLVFLGNILAAYILYISSYQDKYLSMTETFTVFYVAIIQNCTLINITFPNRNSGLSILKTCIKIDVILGINETKFMRTIATATFVVLAAIIAIVQVVVSIVLYNAYSVNTAIHVVGTINFIMVFLIFFDACFLVAFCTFLSLRVHYLSVALMKLAKMNTHSYIANQLFFNGILWRKTYDKLVTFHERADEAQYIKVLGLIFEQLRRLENSFRFTIFVSMNSLILGTFNGVQTILLHKELPDINILRTASVIGWVFIGWMYLLSLSQNCDIFCREIEKIKLICTYIQLKPLMSARVLKLTKTMLRLLDAYDPRVSIYNMFYFNTKLLLQIFASLFVYITVQLQLMSPVTRTSEVLTNVTIKTQRIVI